MLSCILGMRLRKEDYLKESLEQPSFGYADK